MSLFRKLIDEFADRVELPIEVWELREAVLRLGVQDDIVFHGKDADTTKIWGAFYQFRRSNGVYAPPDFCTLIAYNTKLTVEWQRVVCAKELVHVFDRDEEKTDTAEELAQMVAKLLGPLSTDDFTVESLMALKDQIALYQCLPLLFPAASRTAALEAIRAKRHTAQTIAAQASVPVELVELMLKPEWPGISASFLADC